MKIRTDFVTNSSSSSYIVAYKNNDDLVEAINKFTRHYIKSSGYNEYDDDYTYSESYQYKYVISMLFSGKMSYKQALKKVKSFAEDNCWYTVAQTWDKSKYPTQSEWVHSKEYKLACKAYVDKCIKKFREKYDANSFVSYLYFSSSNYMYDVKDNLEKLLDGVYMKSNGD